jgi:predicted MFS family arabinose efflux permease
MTERDRRDPFRLKVACFISTFDRFAMPPMLVGIARSMDVPLTQVAAAAGVYFLTYGLMQPVWGVLSTRIGLARTMRWSIAAGSLATIASALAPGIASLTISRAVAGGFFSAALPSALIYVGATAAPHRRQREVTDLMTGVALGTASTTVIAGSLTYLADWRWAFALTGAVCLLLATLSVARLTELERTPFRSPLVAPLRQVMSNRSVYQLLLLAILDGMAILGALTFLPAAVESTGRNAAVAALVTATYGVGVLVAAPVVGRFSRRVAASQFIFVGSLVGASACGLLAFSVGVATALVASILLGVAWASMHSSLQTWATEVTPAERGLAVSFFSAALFAGSALAATLGGPFAERDDFTTLFTAGTVVLVTIGICGYVARARWEHHQ